MKMPWHAASNIVYWTLPCNSSNIWKHTEKDHKILEGQNSAWCFMEKGEGLRQFAFYLNFWKKVKINKTTMQLPCVREIWELLVLEQAWTQGFSSLGSI